MSNLTQAIQKAASRVLAEGRAEAVLGYAPGSKPWRSRPVVITRAEEASRLCWPSFGLSLANYLPKLKGRKVALLVNGCTGRALVVLMREGQLRREDLYLIGLPCPGFLEAQKVRSRFPQLKKIKDDLGAKVLVETLKGTEEVLREELLRPNCRLCRRPTPPLYDELLEGPSYPEKADPYEELSSLEALAPEERWSWFEEKIFSRCLRCYACRNACPLCYCPTCFVDDSRPQWVGKTRAPVDTALYHLVRAFHLAGRCVDCGACEEACPMDIPVRLLHKKLAKEAAEAFGYEAGLDPEASLLLDTFQEDDPEDFMITKALKSLEKI